jgi:outer membrane protein assembly factor BamB
MGDGVQGTEVVDSSPAVGADGTVYVGSWVQKLHAVTPEGQL